MAVKKNSRRRKRGSNPARPFLVALGAISLGLFGLLQVIPYGRNHTNPPKLAEPEWDSPETRDTFFRVCRDCHSNETSWPWYSFVAPASWLVQYDVDEARSHLNVSEWGRGKQHGEDAAQMGVEEGLPGHAPGSDRLGVGTSTP